MSEENMNSNNVVTVDLAELAKSTDVGLQEIAKVKTLPELENWQNKYLGEGSVLLVSRSKLSKIAKELKAETGKAVNLSKTKLESAYKSIATDIQRQAEEAKLQAEKLDLTIPVGKKPLGALHPINSLVQQVAKIFSDIGWRVVDGPEIESASYNFDALNFLPDHPSRSLQDTFHVAPLSDNTLLRTHTSPVQIRTLLKNKPPVYIISPGRVFRSDSLDATHTPVFHQLEGLAVDKDLTMADLIGTLEYLAKNLFNSSETKVRLRPHFFPFTEPSAEIDVWFPDKKGGAGWVEWGGCGMVHPHVLQSAGIDPNEYQGFAFGMGLERTLQFKNGINNMRDIVEGDIRFTSPFGIN